MDKKIVIYSTPTCSFCHLAKEFFKENNIEFIDINVAEDQQHAQEMVEKTGQMGVPVIVVTTPPASEEEQPKEEIIIGFDEDRLREILEVKDEA